MGSYVSKETVAKSYAVWAPFYDFVFGGVFRRARLEAIAAAERAGRHILEVGVGTGISLPDYSTSSRLTGVDISAAMLRKAQEKVRNLGLNHVEGLAVMDAEKMAFPDASFEVIVAQLVVTTVPNPEATLDEFVRVLKPGGEIVLVSRVGADKGLRRLVEKSLTPITRLLGWRLEFPFERYTRWVEQCEGVRVIENRSMPPFGHFSVIRFGKAHAVTTQGERSPVRAAA
jgi:phosphatidylethanolamine/phosphatidyl-N-methylethanolamine N-methyltransferase